MRTENMTCKDFSLCKVRLGYVSHEYRFMQNNVIITSQIQANVLLVTPSAES